MFRIPILFPLFAKCIFSLLRGSELVYRDFATPCWLAP
jgi:hypothetical protein